MTGQTYSRFVIAATVEKRPYSQAAGGGYTFVKWGFGSKGYICEPPFPLKFAKGENNTPQIKGLSILAGNSKGSDPFTPSDFAPTDPFVSRAHVVHGPLWSQCPFGPRAHLGPGPVWTQCLFGRWARLGPEHILGPGRIWVWPVWVFLLENVL